MSKRAVILAGGRGSRLRPYTVVLPKPLMPVGPYSILEIIVRQLAKRGFGRITMAVYYKAESIKALFGDGSKWGVAIDYSLEDRPLSTIAPLRLIPDLPVHFLVMNGDVLTDLDFGTFYETHVQAQGAGFTISCSRRQNLIDYGVLDTSDGRLVGFKEKPVSEYVVSMGVYMVSRRILDYVPENQSFGFDDLMHTLLNRGELVRTCEHKGYWLDIGRPDDYLQAIEEFDRLKSVFL
ncbi:MAG: nucleotidyltransferase family protein [Acidobacteria bacterium]|nr:MAG: nucleotidyltransferase family protein [Acidobacteriota bacterium]